MTDKIEDGESTRDTYIRLYGADAVQRANGQDHTFTTLSPREYAAIKLKIPNSGDSGLDRIITESLRHDYAGIALQGMLAGLRSRGQYPPPCQCAREAYEHADAMIAERIKK